MSRELGLTQDWHVVIAGLGNLGHALANYGGFTERGFPVAALIDADPKVVGTAINGITVRHIDELAAIAAEHQIAIGIIATPAHAAQEVADRLIAAGVSSILNFAPTIVSVPPEVSLRKVDLAVELQILSFYQQRRGDGAPPLPAAAPPRRLAMPVDEPLYPVNLVLAGRRCLVVGGGRVALTKVRGLVDAGAGSPSSPPRSHPTWRRWPRSLEARPYRPGEAAGYRLVIAATGDPGVNQQVYDDGEAAGVWVNSADDPAAVQRSSCRPGCGRAGSPSPCPPGGTARRSPRGSAAAWPTSSDRNTTTSSACCPRHEKRCGPRASAPSASIGDRRSIRESWT